MSEWADNYDASATVDDGSCNLVSCDLEWADNYNDYVTIPVNNSCYRLGCTNEWKP